MKLKFSIILFFISISIFSQSYVQIWSDEFTSSQINSSVWKHETGGGGWGNNELQYYSDRADNSYIQNGNLVIEAKKESFGGRNYTSARLITLDKISFKYGKIEARIKLPYGQGLWPAFWMMGTNINSVGWPKCGEIDILEMIGGGSGDRKVYGTAHWDNNGQHASYGQNYSISSGKLADAYHLFSIEWTPQYIKWFIDGHQYNVLDITGSGLSEFQNDFFILLNVAVGGDWPGSPDASTVFPQKMLVDYVRVYQDAAQVPKITISSPTADQNFNPGDDILIQASVQASTAIDRVDFYQDAVLIGRATELPYEWNWSNIQTGCYNISAEVFTSKGYSTKTDITNISVGSDCSESPYTGKEIFIPGKIEVENFNNGGSDLAYHDNTPLNVGGEYRMSEGVDIETCSDVNEGFNVGWLESGEWMNYMINVSEDNNYEFHVRSASESATGIIKILIDGTDVSGELLLNQTGGWQTWQTTIKGNIPLTKGKHNLRVSIISGGFNLNYIGVYLPNSVPSIELTFPNGGETLKVGDQYNITWNSVMVEDVAIGYSYDNGSNWDFISEVSPDKLKAFRWKIPDTKSSECLVMLLDKTDNSVRGMSTSTFTISDVVSVEDENIQTGKYELYKNYPNPFNPSTTISYRLNKPGFVKLSVYDVMGKEVARLANEKKESGYYEVNFDASNLSSGIYIYRLTVNNFIQSNKMLLLK